MKKILFILLAFVPLLFTSCEEEWSGGDPAMDHIYYFGFQEWADYKNSVKFNVNQGETIGIPVEFQSAFVRDYDVTTFYYVSGTAVALGTDYQIVDENGAVLTPAANGAFSMVWPQAKRGVKNIYVKALNGAKGNFKVQTFEPTATVPSQDSIETTVQVRNDIYEVRGYSQNYYVTVTIK